MKLVYATLRQKLYLLDPPSHGDSYRRLKKGNAQSIIPTTHGGLNNLTAYDAHGGLNNLI